VAAAAFFFWYSLNQQDQSASLGLSQAVRTLDTPLRDEGTPPQPENPSFGSATERATEAHKEFQAIVDKYPHTRSAEIARYFVGLTEVDLGDNAGATRELQSVAESRNEGLSALAKFALASVYRNQGHNKQAIELYTALIAKPTSTVSKATAQLEMAAAYEADQQPLEARRIYQQVQKENPASPAAQLATEKLQGQR
jgi:TolA-binding protein